jgi:Penicillin amidase
MSRISRRSIATHVLRGGFVVREKRGISTPVRAMAVAALLVFLLMSWRTGDIRAADTGFTNLDVDGEQVRIYRDEYGVPHIFAETNKGLFQGYGYAIAQDRLWQLELARPPQRRRILMCFAQLPRSRTLSSSTMAVIEVSYTVSVFVDHYAFVLLRRGSPGPTMRQSSPTNALVKRAQPLSLSLSEAEDQSPGLH